jgi:adenine phosphoribosyltransferase
MPRRPPQVTDDVESAAVSERLAGAIRAIPDFPSPGIVFRDITTLVGDAEAFRTAVDELVAPWRDRGVDLVAGIESRGFVLGGALAYLLGVGFVPVRKQGRLPSATVSVAYALEYGEAVLEMHADAVAPGQRVLIVDDLLATGGTAAATIDLVSRLGGAVAGLAFLIELADLNGTGRLGEYEHTAVITI